MQAIYHLRKATTFLKAGQGLILHVWPHVSMCVYKAQVYMCVYVLLDSNPHKATHREFM